MTRYLITWSFLHYHERNKKKMVGNGMDNLAPSQQFDFFSAGLASGRTDIFDPFLGPSPRVPDGNPYDMRNTAKFNLPEDKVGKNLQLRDTMEDMMLTAQWDFWTTRIMPWYRTNDIHTQWNEWENNPAYMGVTPHQTTSRVVTQKRTVRKASMIRRGIAAEFEEDFIQSDLGRTSFWASLKQMARSVQETANVEVLRALLYCHRFQQNYTLKYKVVAKDDLDAWIERRAERFMIAQKHEKGLETINTHIDREQEMWGGKANVWILGREIMDYCSLIPPGKTWYFLGGQEAVDRLNGAPGVRTAAGNTMGNLDSLQPVRMIKDTPVFIAKSYAVEGIGKAELMSRITEIGIYNLMVDRTRDYSKYRTEGRTIRVYNNGRDGWSDIQLAEAIQNAGCWENKTGNLFDPFEGQGGSGDHFGVDGEYDFLSKRVGGNKRKNISYLGEMDPRFLDTQHLLNCGQTLLQAAGYHDETQIRAVAALLNATPTLGTDNLATGDLLNLQNRLASLTGGEGNALSGKLGKIVRDATTLNQDGKRTRPAFKTNTGGNVTIDSSKAINATIQTWFDELLSTGVPDSHKTQFQAIASKVDLPWQERSKQVKTLIAECNRADPSSTGQLKTAANIDKWHATCERQLKTELDALATAAPTASAAKIGAQQQEVEYFPVDASLPAGYKWAGPPQEPLGKLSSFPGLVATLNALEGAPQQQQAGGRRLVGNRYPGSRSDPAQEEQQRETTELAGYDILEYQLQQIWSSSAPLPLRIAATLIATTPVKRNVLINMARGHVAIPLGFALFRSHATYKTRFGIKCAANGETGYTMFGNSNMMIAHEAARKVGMMHYTAYLSAVVMFPKNVFVVEDLYCERYLGGMDVSFWSPERYTQSQANRRASSIICAPLPPSCKELDEHVDMRGRWYTENELALVSQERYDRPCYPGAARMNARYKWYDAVRKDRGANRGRIPPNYTCSQGMEWYYNTKTNNFDDFTVESGCMGPKVYPGCGKVRNGQLLYLKDPQYQGGGAERFC
jgi:hypothetical protein